LISPAFAVGMLAAIESLLSAAVADGMTGGRHRPNMELVRAGRSEYRLGSLRWDSRHRRNRTHGHEC